MANSPARSTIDVGSVIAETYTIEALVGRGGMGAVFLASHNRLPGKKVAIKLLHAELHEEEVMARFRREAEIASRLGHPNIVTVHDFNITSDGTPYLVLEYLEGESLAQRLRSGPPSIEQVFSIVRQVGSALAAAHREGIVHRDLKPQNIFLIPTEVDGRIVEIAKVLDFGISKIRGSQTVKTQESMLLGTPQYMAPEQAKGEHTNVDERTDVFAFGAIVYEMLAGHPAFSGASIPEVVFKVVYEQPLPLAQQAPTAPPEVIAAVVRAMAKVADDRFATVSMFVEAMTGQPVTAFRVPSIPPPDDGVVGTGSRVRSTGKEAFAQTMGSGDYSDSSLPAAPQPIKPGPMISPQAQTLASQAAGPLRARRSPALIIGVAMAAALVAVLVMYVVMWMGRTEPARRAVAGDAAIVAVPADAAAIEVDAAVVVAVVDAAAPAVSVDAAVVAIKPPPRNQTEPDDNEDPTIGRQITQAEHALRDGKYAVAERLATGVINTTAGPRQTARAHGVRGAVQCALHDNEERALIELRNIDERFRAVRQLLITTCRKFGYLR